MARFIVEKNKKPHNKVCRLIIHKAEEMAKEINSNPWHPCRSLNDFRLNLLSALRIIKANQPPNVAAGEVEISIYNITFSEESPKQAIGIRKPGDSTRNTATIILEADKTTERYG